MADNSYSIPFYYVTGSMDISSANSVTQIMPAPWKLQEIRVFCGVATATAAETMTVTKRKYPGTAADSSDYVNIGTFPVVSTLAVGDEVRVSLENIADVEGNAGEEIKILCGNSTGTGTVYFALHGYHYTTSPNPVQSFTAQAKPISGAGTIKYAAFTAT